jgi:Grx4 family monothiol glutaredoxin
MSTSAHVIAVNSVDELNALKAKGNPVALYFAADWCEPCVGMNVVFATLANDRHGKMTFAQIDTEKAADELTERFNVASVPTFVILSPSLEQSLARVEGADAAKLTLAVHQHAPLGDHPTVEHVEAANSAAQPLEDRLRSLVNKAPVMLFMKGTPDEPKCGFSKKMVALLRKYHDTSFGSFDILSDLEVREGLKKFSNWPTYPQLYAGGKLLGGLDVATELDEEGELHATLVNAAAHANK